MSLDHQLEDLLALAGAPLSRRAWEAARDTGLRLPQLMVLIHLRDRGSMSVSEIGQLVDLSPSAGSHLVDRLFERGLVTRTEDAADRRQRRIAVTADGLAMLARFRDACRLGFAEWAESLDAGRREPVTELVERALALCARP